jgi:hypothetical protein
LESGDFAIREVIIWIEDTRDTGVFCFCTNYIMLGATSCVGRTGIIIIVRNGSIKHERVIIDFKTVDPGADPELQVFLKL